MIIDKIKEQIEYKNCINYVIQQLKKFEESNVKQLDIDIKFFDNIYGKCSTPLYFNRFNKEFTQEWIEYNINFFNEKINKINSELNDYENLLK